MRGSKREREAVKASFMEMNPKEKLEYIITYYKFPIFTAVIVIAFLITSA